MTNEVHDLDVWVEKMGYNKRQLTDAVGLFGMSSTNLTRTRSNKRELTLTERLAMSAVRAGLPPWEPSKDPMIKKKGIGEE